MTCLVCNITVYRVLVVVPVDVEAKVGPIMPTEDWVEQDVLLSTSGWIQVHLGKSGCIVSNHEPCPALSLRNHCVCCPLCCACDYSVGSYRHVKAGVIGPTEDISALKPYALKLRHPAF